MTMTTDPQTQAAHQAAGYRRFIGCIIFLVMACVAFIAAWAIRSSLRPCQELDLLLKRSGCEQVVDPAQSAQFRLSQDGSTILELIHNTKKQMNIIDTSTGTIKEIRSDDGMFENGPGALMEDIALTHDGDYAAVVSGGYLGIVDINQQLPTSKWIDLPEKAFAMRVAVSPDQKLMAAAISDGDETYVNLYQFPNGEKIGDFKETGENYAVAFSPTGELITAFGTQIQYWDVDSKTIIKQIGENLLVRTLMFTPNGQYLIATTGDDYSFGGMAVEVFEPDTADRVYRFDTGSDDHVYGDLLITVSADSNTLVMADCKAVRFFSLSDGSQIKKFSPYKEFSGFSSPCLAGFQFTPDGTSYYYAWDSLSIIRFRLEMK